MGRADGRRVRSGWRVLLPVFALVAMMGGVGVVGVVGAQTQAAEPTPETSVYVAVTPQRVLDTRTGLGGHQGPLGSHVLALGGVSVPAEATAVALNVTVTGSTADSYVTLQPAGQAPAYVSSLNFLPGDTVANLVVVKLGVDGEVWVSNAAGTAEVIADLSGYYVPGSGAVGPPGPQGIQGEAGAPATTHAYVASSSSGTVTGPTAPAGSYLVEVNYSGMSPLSCTVDLGDGTTPVQTVHPSIPAGTAITVGATPGTIGEIKTAVSNELKYGVTYTADGNVSVNCGVGSSSSIVMTPLDTLN